jgi:hypothetical protein
MPKQTEIGHNTESVEQTEAGHDLESVGQTETGHDRIIFLDDDQNRISNFVRFYPRALLAYTAEECIGLIQDTPNSIVFLDHDLDGRQYVDTNEKNTGSEVVRWIVANRPLIKEIIIHSHNHEAAANMSSKLKRAGYKQACVPFVSLIAWFENNR